MGNEEHPYKNIARYPYMGKFKQSIYGLPLSCCLMSYFLLLIIVVAYNFDATFVIL